MFLSLLIVVSLVAQTPVVPVNPFSYDSPLILTAPAPPEIKLADPVVPSVLGVGPKVKKVDKPADPTLETFTMVAGEVLFFTADTGSVWDVSSKLPHTAATFGDQFMFNAPAGTDAEFIVSCTLGKGTTKFIIKVTSPNPNPGPSPKPVIPPINDAFVAKLKAAYTADLFPNATLKPKALDKLIILYNQAQSEAVKKDNPTIGSLIGVIQEAGKSQVDSFIKENGLPASTDNKSILNGVRTVISQEVAATFPDDVAMDDASRVKMQTFFKKVEDSLKAVK